MRIVAMLAMLAAVSPGKDSVVDAIRMAGWEAAYRTDYTSARHRFEELLRLSPAHPMGDLSMASIIWQEYLFQTRRLQSDLYRKNSNFYDGAQRTKEGSEGDAMDARVDAAFQEHLGRAISKAQAMVDAAPKSVDGLYFLGAAYGVRSAYEASAQRKFWAAVRDGMRSVKLHRRVLAMRPDYYDVYLTLGAYDYAVGCIPQPFRLIATMAGIRGGKRKGIQELEMVARQGNYNRDDARALLIALYRYENNPQKALAELREFSARYPENLVLRMETASTLAQLGRPVEAAAVFEALLREPDQRLADLTLYQYGEALALERAYVRAEERFAAVEHAPGAERSLVTQALLRAGQMADLAGRREQAIQYYRLCLQRGPRQAMRASLERWVRKPFTGK